MNTIKLFFLMMVTTHTLTGTTLNVVDFGAKGDGKTVNTTAIQTAIDLCSQTGGKVIFSDGEYVTGTIQLKDNVTLVVGKGAKILGATDLKDYPEQKIQFRFYADNLQTKALIYANGAKNIGIEGDGTIDGQGGAPAFAVTHEMKGEGIMKHRAFLIWFVECIGVKVKDLELRSSALWMQKYMGCDDVRIENIKLFNHCNVNNDMIDIVGCCNVIIKGVIGDTADDGITFKSTYDRVSENIIVSDCMMASHCNALKFGTETFGGFRNVTITNCVIRSSTQELFKHGEREGTSGISLEIADGAIMENVNISNILIDGPKVPIFVSLVNRGRKMFPEAKPKSLGCMKNINISNVIASVPSKVGVCLLGIPNGYVENISLSNMKFICTGGGNVQEAGTSVEERNNSYPDAKNYPTFPAYGVFARHIKGLTLSNIQFELLNSDQRPLMILDDVQYGTIKDIEVTGKSSPEKYRIEKNCNHIITKDKN